MTNQPQASQNDERMNQAIAWHVRLLSGDITEQERDEYAAWLLADAENVAAYESVQRRWQNLEQAKTAVLERFPVGGHSARQRSSWFRAPRLYFPLATMAAVLLLGVSAIYLRMERNEPQIISTGPAVFEIVVLADGSSFELDAMSEAAVAITDDRRSVELRQGAAVFDVTPSPIPFIVSAQGREIRVLGTQFEVVARGEALSVSVARGSVSVDSLELGRGQAVGYAKLNAAPQRREFDPEQIALWRQGQLVFSNEPLGEVVAALNRYIPTGAITLSDAQVAALTFTGVLQIDDGEVMARRLSALMDLEIHSAAGVITLSQAAPR